MKKTLAIFLCVFLAGCMSSTKKLGPESYIDLSRNETPCDSRVFPHLEGTSCAAGEFDCFTIRQITDFGERPVWSPDGKKIAFMDKEFGNAYELDLASGKIECITCEFEHEGRLGNPHLKPGVCRLGGVTVLHWNRLGLHVLVDGAWRLQPWLPGVPG